MLMREMSRSNGVAHPNEQTQNAILVCEERVTLDKAGDRIVLESVREATSCGGVPTLHRFVRIEHKGFHKTHIYACSVCNHERVWG